MRHGQHVVVAEHDALGPAGGAGGVDDRGQGMRVRGQRRGRPRGGGRLQPGLDIAQARVRVLAVVALEQQHALQAVQIRDRLREPPPVRPGLHQQQAAPGVVEDVGHVVRPVLGVQRHHHQAQPLGGLVEADPVGTVAQLDGDTLAGLEPLGGQRGAPAGHPRTHVLPVDLAPGAFGLVEPAVGGPPGAAAHPLLEQAGERSRSLDRDNVFGPILHALLPAAASRGVLR